MTTLTKEVTLAPKDSQIVSFQVIPPEARSYQVSVNGLSGSFRATAIPVPFDPWVYDTDGDCYIGKEEALQATNDYFAGLMTQAQYLEVKTLYDNNTRNPACELPPPPPTDYLTMTKDELYNYLINGSVAADWWNLSYDDRKQLGLKMARWWSYEWFGAGVALARGEPTCGGIEWFNPREEPEKTISKKIGIGMEFCSGLRYCLFSDNTIAPTDIYWWRNWDEKWHCYNPGVCFHLPMGVAIGDADWLNCLQLAEDVSKLDSWLFFQTYFIECWPGFDAHLWPINVGGIGIYEVAGIDDRGRTTLGSRIALIYY